MPPPPAPPHGQFQEQLQHQEALMLTRRQKTLSSISNFVPLHIKLNLPKGVEFNVTVPRSFTIEQLARQIEAEYAYMVEREIGHSSYPVIQCGALFDHIGDRSSRPRPASLRKTVSAKPDDAHTSNPSDLTEHVQCPPTAECDGVNSESSDDERDEADTRGVQLRFADKVGEVLDRYSTVHVVNIDQGVGLGRKLSLSNLTLAANEKYIARISETGVDTRESMTTLCQDPPKSENPDISSTSVEDAVSHENYPSLQAAHTSGSPDHPTSENANHDVSDDHSPETAPQESTRPVATQNAEETTCEEEADPSTVTPSPHEQGSELKEKSLQNLSSGVTKDLAEEATTTTATEASGFQSSQQNPTTNPRQSQQSSRSRATDILLNLEASSNDARFQEILHNTIALDHFRQFCFQEYSIENLLFWMDVELFAKPSLETLNMGASRTTTKEKPQDDHDDDANGEDNEEYASPKLAVDYSRPRTEGDRFAIQHARYIYLTYIDTNGPLQVNLSDESRSEIPWPILDPYASVNKDMNHGGRQRSFSTVSTPCPSSPQSVRSHAMENSSEEKETRADKAGWLLDRHIFDGAQEHTYQLMKGHTLVRFEESDLWKKVQKIMREQPEEYARATITGPLNSYYRPDPTVVISIVAQSKSCYPSGRPETLYNWNNSTSDLDRSKDKEEALAMTMSQYFGPIPAELRHPSRSMFGPDHNEYGDDIEDEYEDELDAVLVRSDSGRAGATGQSFGGGSKRSSTATIGATYVSMISPSRRRSRFGKRLNGGLGRASKRSSYVSTASEILSMDDDLLLPHHFRPNRLSLVENMDWVENERRRTRWMVAGYFNDQVRLTEAQRKRLLRRNIKLTKFFGSRVDGTLLPVEGVDVDHFSNGAANGNAGNNLIAAVAGLGAVAAPLSSLAFPLSASLSHDLNIFANTTRDSLKKDRKAQKTKSVEPVHWANLLDHSLLPASDDMDILSKSKTTAFIQKFRRHSPDYDEDGMRGVIHSMSSPCSPKQGRSHDSPYPGSGVFASTSPFFKRYSGYSTNGHHRSATIATALDIRRPPSQLMAHPHPLWSGPLSDQEAQASASNGRIRSLSFRSDGTGTSTLNPSIEVCHPLLSSMVPSQAPTVPASQDARAAAAAAMETMVSMEDLLSTTQPTAAERYSMVSRRKKADKLSTFFGTKLTTQELSSQLTMNEEVIRPEGDPKLIRSKSKGDKDKEKEKEKDMAAQPPLAPAEGPSMTTVNQLSNKERTILWKRNKKLRGLLGESLPESEVAAALTRPVLLCSGGQRRTSMSRPLRTACVEASLYEKSSLSPGLDGFFKTGSDQGMVDRRERSIDSEHLSIKRPSAEGLTVQTTMWNNSVMKSKCPSGRVVKRSGNTAVIMASRSRRTSAASISPGLRPRSARGGAVGPNRSLYTNSTESLLDDWEEDYSQENVADSFSGAWSPLESKRRRPSHRRPSVLSLSSPSPSPLGELFPLNERTAVRLARKRKMDKIQQFLGDRIPTEELWIGAVGKESTQRMMDLNLLSSPEKPTLHEKSSTTSRLPPASSLVRATRTRLASSTSGSMPTGLSLSGTTATIFRKRVPTNRNKGEGTAFSPPLGAFARGVTMERSFSDPPVASSRVLGEDDCVTRPMSQQNSGMVNRLRQRLAADSRGSGMDQGDSRQDIEVLSLSATTDSMSDSNDSCTPLTEMQSYTSSSTGIDTLEPPYANDPAGSRCESEEYSEIIPKLRSMTHQDQEKFFKRAEKLEKMFGSIPTSTLIESSLTTPHAAGQRPRSPFQPPPSVSRAAAMAATAAAADNHGSDQRGLVELAEFWASGNSSSGGSSSSEDGRTSEERELVRRSFSEEIVESLAMVGIM